MGRTKGLLSLSGNFEPQVAGPFDARSRVETKADLLLLATWQAKDGNPYTYVGMVVTVYADTTEKNNGIYRLKAADYTQEGNWEKAGDTVDLNAIDTQLNTASVTETVTDNTLLYIIGKFKANALVLYNYIKAKLDLVYAAINHNHTLSSLSEKSYNSLSDKPSIPSIAGLMVEAEYTGTGTKKVNSANSAVSSDYAGRAYADTYGRTIHQTYALKQSGVTPPETARVILDDTTPTYTIVALTAENLIVENNATTGGKILAPALAADKTLKISIIGNDTLLDGTSYADGVTIFGIYEASTETWTFNSILDPTVPDYSDMTVDVMLENPTVITSMGNGIIVAQFISLSKTVFIRTHSTAIGIYQCVAIYAMNAYLQPIAAGTALHTVRVKDGDVWYSQYDGKNAGTLFFERITVEKLAITKQGFNGELSPVVYPVDRQRTVIGYKLGSNATDFSVTINSVNYTKADVANVVVPVNTEITINDVTIAVGKDTGNVVLILK